MHIMDSRKTNEHQLNNEGTEAGNKKIYTLKKELSSILPAIFSEQTPGAVTGNAPSNKEDIASVNFAHEFAV